MDPMHSSDGLVQPPPLILRPFVPPEHSQIYALFEHVKLLEHELNGVRPGYYQPSPSNTEQVASLLVQAKQVIQQMTDMLDGQPVPSYDESTMLQEARTQLTQLVEEIQSAQNSAS